MVESNQEPVQSLEPEKKKKASPKPVKSKDGDKAALKKLAGKKDSKPVKTAGSGGGGKGQTIAGMKKFIKGAWNELKKVHWPNRRELIAFTSVVLVAVGMVAVLIFMIDSVLSKLLEFVVR